MWNTSLVPIQWAKPHDATKMPQLLCVKLEDSKNLHPRPWGDHVLSYTWVGRLCWWTAVQCTTRPACLLPPRGVGGGRVTVPRGGPRPATRSIRRPVGTLTQHVANGIIRCIAQTCAVRTQHEQARGADVSFSWQEKLRRVSSLKLLQTFVRDMELKLKKNILSFVHMGLGLKMLKVTWEFANFYNIFVSALLRSLKALKEAPTYILIYRVYCNIRCTNCNLLQRIYCNIFA